MHFHHITSSIIHHKNRWKSFKKNCSKREFEKIQSVQILCTSFTDVKHSHDVCQHVKIIFRFILSGIGPLRWNGRWFSYVYIKALSDGMVIDFLSLHQGPLRWNGHWFSFFTSRPSLMEWSLIFLCSHQGPLWWNGHWFSYVYIKALSDGMVVDFLIFTSRSSLMEWSLIFLCLHQGPLRWNGRWFSYVYIKALSDGMVIDFPSLHQGPLRWNGHWFSFFTSRPSPMEWSLISLSHHDPLL